MEERLPAGLFYNAEWKALGEGKNLCKYIPLSLIETIVPLAFLGIYIVIYLVTRDLPN